MSIEDQNSSHKKVEVSTITGDTESYDDEVFTNTINRRRIDLIERELRSTKPRMILDYGCGKGWISTLLLSLGFETVGIDLSSSVVKQAKLMCHQGEFIACDAEKLPFRDAAFDCVIGISILHHLPNIIQAFGDLRRVLIAKSSFVFMEPNLLNPVSAAGMRLFPMARAAHTEEEKQFTPDNLRAILNQTGFNVEECFALFFLAFPISRLFKIARMKLRPSISRLISLFENVMEKMPGMRYLNSNIVAIGTCVENTS